MASIHLEARSTCRDSHRLDAEELEEIMFAVVLQFAQLLMPCSTTHCMRMATSSLGLLQEVVRMKTSVSFSIAGQDLLEIFMSSSFLQVWLPDWGVRGGEELARFQRKTRNCGRSR